MDKLELKEIRYNLSLVLISSVLTVLVVNIAGIVISASTSYETYAGYKAYGIYAGYNALFHLGIPTGVYLQYGDKTYDELSRGMMRAIFRVLLIAQAMFALIAIAVYAIIDKDITWVMMVIVNIPLININSYFTYVNQSTKRFKIDFLIQLIQCIAYISIMALALNGLFVTYTSLLIAVTATNIMMNVVQIICNKEIVFGKAYSLNETRGEIIKLSSLGKWVLFGDVTIAFLLGIDSMFAEACYSTTQFAIYAFGVSIVNAIYMFMLYVNNIVYPYLVRSKDFENASRKLYSIMVGMIVAVLPTYYVLEKLIQMFFHKYHESIPVIKMLYIAMVLRGLTVCYFGDICKVKKKNNIFFLVNFVVLLIAVALCVLAVKVSMSFDKISYMTILVSAIWYISFELLGFNKKASGYSKAWLLIALISFLIINFKSIWKSVSLYLLIHAAILCVVIYKQHKKRIGEACE